MKLIELGTHCTEIKLVETKEVSLPIPITSPATSNNIILLC